VIPDLEDTIDEVDDLANELLKDLIPQIKDATKKGEGLAEEMYEVQKKLSGLAGEAEQSANRAASAAGSWREYWNAVNNVDGNDYYSEYEKDKDTSQKSVVVDWYAADTLGGSKKGSLTITSPS
jgi:hypothetical protein